MEYSENLAIKLCEQSLGKKYLYKGENRDFYGAIGTFHLIHDQNCCCPTDQVLFAFETNKRQYYMSAKDFFIFYHASTEVIEE